MNILIAVALSLMNSTEAVELKTGDVLLQQVQCFMCALIEAEEQSAYSHAGVAVVEGSRISVMEAWDGTQQVSLKQFQVKQKPTTKALVLRPIDRNGKEVRFDTRALLESFHLDFEGAPFDPRFEWDDGEWLKFYCSELVAKLLNPFLPYPFVPKPMHFEKHRSYWTRFFGGSPPDGKPGLSPADFERSPILRRIGEI